MTSRLAIVIATSGRFHALDLARELAGLGHQVTLFCDLPASRVALFAPAAGVRIRSFFPFTAPFIACSRVSGPPLFRETADHAGTLLRDAWASAALPPCDVFVSMAGLYTRTGQAARRRGALWVVERGSRHILSQKQILEAIPGWPAGQAGVPGFYVRRNLLEYERADVVSVPARHVAASFRELGFPEDKLFRNPYGVDLAMFPPTAIEPHPVPTALFVGPWSLQKGVDVLVSAWERLPGVNLLHVGPRGDGPPFPREAWFRHVDPVPQWELKTWYARADVFVQPSRQEGLSLVQAQALACGLPLVCTDRTGGEDLRDMIRDRERVTVVPHDDPAALAAGIRKGLAKAALLNGIRDGLGAARESLSWSAYGRRYGEFLEARVSAGRGAPCA